AAEIIAKITGADLREPETPWVEARDAAPEASSGEEQAPAPSPAEVVLASEVERVEARRERGDADRMRELDAEIARDRIVGEIEDEAEEEDPEVQELNFD